MTSYLQIAKRIASDKRFSLVAIAIAIAARVIQLVFFYNIRVDGMYQVQAMQNFAEGHGFSSSYVLPSGLSAVIYEPQINWPPGYSLLLYPFYILFGNNYILGGIAMDITAAVVLIFYTRKILLLLSTPLHYVNLFTLFSGFFIYSFYFICSSDAIAVSFFTVALYYVLLVLKKGQASFMQLLTIALCLFFCGFIKYLFIPVVFIIPVFIFLRARAEKNKKLSNSAVFIFSLLLAGLGALLLWQKLNSGAAAYIASNSRGFFPGNLSNSYPAIPAAIINPDTIGLALKEGSDGYHFAFRVLQIIHLSLLIILLVFFVFPSLKKGWKDNSPRHLFFNLSILLSAAIILLLVLLSLTVGKEENYPGHWWSYADEPRYYGLVTVLVHLCIFLLPALAAAGRFNFKLQFAVLLLLLLPETFRGVIFTAKRILHAGKEQYSWQYEKKIQDDAGAFIQQNQSAHPGEMAVMTGSSYYLYYRVAMQLRIPVMNDSTALMNPGKLNTEKPVALYVLTPDNVQDAMVQAIGHIPSYPSKPLYKQDIAGTFAGYRIYVIHVTPH